MDDRSVCSPQLAKSDALNNTTSFPNAASVIDADKVINTKLDSSQVQGDKDEEELLKGLLNDDYCHVCEAVLLFESQRLSHYEGKKHAQKLKVYLQTKRAEKLHKESTVPQRTMPSDKDRFCELCNMVFSSHLVAKSHYEGKIHAKNLRKQGLQPPGNFLHKYTDVCTLPRLTHDAENADQKSPPEGGVEHHEAPAATTATPSSEVDLKDPNRYCPLCAASFNNPQMALQHYNGRKHQRNQAKQEMIKQLGDDVQQANSLMCQTCSLQFNSLEMYQAHVHGNKHQFREKKVTDLCKSQQKVYGTFADELTDYIQAQKARGITPKNDRVQPQGDTQMEDEEEEEGVKVVFDKRHIIELNKPMPSLTPTSDPHHSRPSSYYPAEGRHPPYQGPRWPPHNWDYNCPPPVLPGSPQLTSRLMKRRRRRKQSSSSSYTTSSSSSSSSSSSDSSSMSDSDDSEYKRREKRKIRRSKKERGRRARDEEFDKEERQGKLQRKERDNEKMMRKREESGEWEQERRRKKLKKHGKRRRKDKKKPDENCEGEGGDGAMDNVKPEEMDNTKYTEVHIQAEINVEEEEGEQDESAKPKYRKEKKKTKEREDTRTEEEKLWDDSILGC
ncbi:zinc finger matrin-type protein 1 isoform X1 [Hippoglossus hippoglossus]|uniref:zinc finger matrin-type protein 1 isoform X1 n=1 Tax=Hippoglossus hippoglossus TaxID=8267 RepID=UPI00148CE729|nr:zinc finger matrin-type protein 1 isoform X1 [Hippoglossus hippoglossus]